MPTRITRRPNPVPWQNAFGLLLALFVAAVAFLLLLRAAGVQNLPGEALLDKVPGLARSSAANESGIVDPLAPGMEPRATAPRPQRATEEAAPRRLGLDRDRAGRGRVELGAGLPHGEQLGEDHRRRAPKNSALEMPTRDRVRPAAELALEAAAEAILRQFLQRDDVRRTHFGRVEAQGRQAPQAADPRDGRRIR